ncbi:C4-type zinc ribbon domain-containing protein [Microbacterium sp. LRZ72]|uniref:zinc ribbon domain-containing protein n=1 Tax=Microbacterium sp. LRZ72 TaxID=2942481 RepID=UPI0029B93EA7|nr:C4-type zinc ribbon domain-containing protein [Microbacterium sp. LRZ72]MDX2375436.1 C4-type zinc ribbon domain-containing protein [Microbacterium sp. LRZ72]
MNASPADQRTLLEIADLDARITQADSARRTPPQAARVKELVAQRQSVSQELVTRLAARDDLQAELKRIESDVSVVEARRARDTEMLKTVSSPKDAAGLEHELASLAKRQDDLETSELAVMERLDEANAAVAEQEALAASTNEEGARLSAEAKKHVSDATTLHEQLTRDRAAVAARIAPQLLAQYDRIAARGPGAGLLRARTCGGCHMMLSGTDLQTVRAAAEDEVVTCPECGCILVRTDESGL